MANVQRISSFQSFLPLYLPQDIDKQYQWFLNSNLGKVYQAIPWKKLALSFNLKDAKKGPSSIFSPEGKVALMFLKSYSQASDQQLIEQINGNIHYQFFCGIRLLPGQNLENYKVISKIRCELADSLNVKKKQAIFANHWKDYLTTKFKVLMDATCYESSIRFPTDQKLIWESVIFLYSTIKKLSKKVGLKMLRTKYKKWKKRYSKYSCKKKDPKKKKIL